VIRRIDLLPAAYAERRRDRRNRLIVVMATLALVVVMLLYYFYLGSQISDARNELAAAQARNAQLQAQINELQTFAELDAEVKAKKIALATAFAGDIDWPAIMTEVAMVVPGEIWLDNFTASAGLTEGAAQVTSETNVIRLSGKTAVGRISFNGNSASCMPGVAKWLIRLATVEEFDAAWLGSAAEPDTRPGCEPPVAFSSTLELNDKAFSHRFEGELE
jgi:Tfp pilus assembly protein PilN